MIHSKTKIIVAESKALIRKGLVALLKNKRDLDIVEAGSGREVLDHLKNDDVKIVLMDANLTILDGRSVLSVMRKRFKEVHAIILSDESDMRVQTEFMAMGASGFICKDCNPATFYTAIQKVKTEGFFFDSITTRALLDSVIREKQGLPRVEEIQFNQRETDIIKKICDGLTNKQIASTMHLSASTIDFYRIRIYEKTNSNNVTGLFRYALKTGLVQIT